MFIASYAGARPRGRPLPALAAAPGGAADGSGVPLPLHLIYSFARDAAHDGVFTFYDPGQLERAAAQQHAAGQRGMLSLAGAGFGWGPTVPLGQWVANAAASLEELLARYSLVGLDINFEEGLEAGGFPEAMAALLAQLKAWRPSLLVSVSPFPCVWPHYRQLLQLAGSCIDYVNWQVYAELESPCATADQIVAAYERLARELGGYSRLTLGVNTEPEQPRGPQLAACLDAFRRLKGKGIGGAFTWALENSAANGYAAERALLAIAAEAGAPQQQPPWQQAQAVPAGWGQRPPQQPWRQGQAAHADDDEGLPPGSLSLLPRRCCLM